MEVLVIAAIIGLIPAYIASSKGKSFVLWWLYGAGLFIIALPHSLIMKADRQSLDQQKLAEGMRKCLYCAEFIRSDAAVCRYCGRNQQSDNTASAPAATVATKATDTRKCPFCAELIRPDAIKCKHCGSAVTPIESTPLAEIATTPNLENQELLKQALDRYNKSDTDGALKLFNKIILSSPNSREAEEAKNKLRRIFVPKELLEKACAYHWDAKDLGMYKLVIAVFPDSPQADYAKEQIGTAS